LLCNSYSKYGSSLNVLVPTHSCEAVMPHEYHSKLYIIENLSLWSSFSQIDVVTGHNSVQGYSRSSVFVPVRSLYRICQWIDILIDVCLILLQYTPLTDTQSDRWKCHDKFALHYMQSYNKGLLTDWSYGLLVMLQGNVWPVDWHTCQPCQDTAQTWGLYISWQRHCRRWRRLCRHCSLHTQVLTLTRRQQILKRK